MLAWLKGCPQRLAVLVARSLNRFLEWLFVSRNPIVVCVRETIRRNKILLSGARRFIRTVRQLPTLHGRLREWIFAGPLQPIMEAREIGGSITASELEQIWNLAKKKRRRILVIATGPELEQIRTIVGAARANALCRSAITPEEIGNIAFEEFDLIIVAPAANTEQQITELQKKAPLPNSIIRVGEASKRSENFVQNWLDGRAVDQDGNGCRSVGKNIRFKKRVVFLNDVGFQYGAGIALRRQAASFLLKGFEVHLVAWTPEMGTRPPAITGIAGHDGWGGVHNIGVGDRDKGKSASQIVADALSVIRTLDPDVIVTGNLHGTGFALELAQGLKTMDALVVSYMHDCFWATGRCAYPTSCQLYQTGCDETCPTPDEYPKLAPDKIAPAWSAKAEIFEGETGIPLVANSGWTRDLAVRRFGDRARIDCVPLAVDHELFAPIPKAVARRLLGLPTGGLFVVMGAVDILNKWKGGNLFREIHSELERRDDVSILLFGQSSRLLKSKKSFGLIQDERLMPFILNAADIFIGTATEEAFGQTLLEASACGVPVVAFDRGGVSDIVIHEQTGLLIKNLNSGELYGAISRLLADSALRAQLGRSARKRVESHFTLAKQGDAWIEYLDTLPNQRHCRDAVTRDAF
jgi:glycosyltransferase involved in cell wall biosynthesis